MPPTAPTLIVAIDQGTTSTRTILFDRTGPVAHHQLEHTQHYPAPGQVEHDPLEIWNNTQETIRRAIERAGATAKDISAIGITNQRETTVAWNRRTGKPYAPAIVWQDTRTRDLCDQFAARHPGAGGSGYDRFREKTGLPLATYFSAPKLRWLLDHHPDLARDAKTGEAAFGTIDTWLLWNLTGGPNGGGGGGLHATDITNASRTMLMNLSTLDWDPDLLSAFDIPHALLPKILPSTHPTAYGLTTFDGPFGAELPITAILGDQQAALVGQTCFQPGQCKNTYGTGSFLLLNTGTKIVPSHHGLLTTPAYQFHNQPAHYALEGSVAVTGSLVQWLRDNLNLIPTSPDIESLAAKVPDNGGVYFVPAFSGLFAPWWDSTARGTLIGLSRHSNKSHIARAALEATAYQTKDVLDAMTQDLLAATNLPLPPGEGRGEGASGLTSGAPHTISHLKVDGGMTANHLLMQFQSDLLNLPITRSPIPETTALGAAYAAGLTTGIWKDQNDLVHPTHQPTHWTPNMDNATRQRLHTTWLKAVERSKSWL